jgi:hypothetical protein
MIFLLIVVLSAGLASAAPRRAPLRVTVAELQQFLEEQQAAHVKDGDLAQKLAGVELSEQLTEFRLGQLKAELKPGEMTATELDLLADLSAFLDPPASEISDDGPPDAATTREMLHAAQSFVAVTLKSLPDFLATRTTRSFEDVPIVVEGSTTQSGMHPMGTHVAEVAYRNGLEFSKDTLADRAGPQKVSLPGLNSAGEFGPVLATVLSDSAEGKIAWRYWQKTSSGTVSVFHYDVPKVDSHYQIDICCAKDPDTKELISYHGKPAYSGFISVNPVTGDVLRLTLEAEISEWDPPPRFGLLVTYGEVQISGKNLISPLRSAVTLRSSWVGQKQNWNDTHVNDVAFTNYRRFGSTARIVPNAASR